MDLLRTLFLFSSSTQWGTISLFCGLLAPDPLARIVDRLELGSEFTCDGFHARDLLARIVGRHSAFLREICSVARRGRPAWDPVGGHGWVPSHTTET
jgi:hypothetical protein